MRLDFTFPGNGGSTMLSIPDEQMREVIRDLLKSNPDFRGMMREEIEAVHPEQE